MTALQPLRAGSPETASPVLSYLGRLAPGSRPAMAGALGRVAGILLGLERSPGEPEGAWQLRQRQAALLVPWHLVRREHTLKVREVLAATCRAPATANKILAGLRGVLEEAWLAGLLPGEDYHRAVKLDPVKGRRVGAGRAVSRGDLQAVIGACYADRTAAGARDVALITVLYATGARRSEASALDLDDWDSDERVLRLLRKRNKEQLVPLPDTRGDAIDDWLEVRGSWPGPLFVSARRGGNLTRARLSDRGIMKILEHRCLQAGVKRIPPHDLRRSLIGDLLDLGVDLSTVQRFVDHENPATTAGYDRRGDRAIAEAAGQVPMPWLGHHPATRNARQTEAPIGP
jgi:integrase